MEPTLQIPTHLSFKKYASVILDVAIHKTLDYGVPEPLLSKVSPGVRVKVPLRGREQSGYIFELKDQPETEKVFAIREVISDTEIITKELFQLCLWVANYYVTPLHQVLKSMIPAPIRKEKKPKEQWFVMRGKTKEELRIACEKLRNKNSIQSTILEILLNTQKGIFLSELLEKAECSPSPVQSLVKKGLLQLDTVRVDRSPLIGEEYFLTKPKTLNTEQQNALESIVKTLHSNQFQTHLLHGVTGSGKTEIYLQAIEKALSLGKGVIILVPEVSLTTQLVERVRSRFEHRIAVLHHRLSNGERYDEWHRIRRGEATIAIGARSVIFSPVQNLGLILVDEEHEHAYKQSEEMPCYHARDVAVMRGKFSTCAVVLGSATPSLESYTNAISGKYLLSNLTVRADTAKIPKIQIIDMREEDKKTKKFTSFSEALLNGIEKRKQSGEQVILFLNRRGYHTTLICNLCETVQKCPHCDLSLAFHKNENELKCHICGYHIPPATFCQQCKSPHSLKFKGIGTEQIEKTLHAIFPDIRTLRLDADTTRHKGSHQKLLRSFGAGKADVLIGTQMIAKGLHFPEVTLVGILNCDMGLHIPDFRASETLFQLVTQVSGRSGRGALEGEVLIQTRLPENSIIQHAIKQDYIAFYQEEIATRKLFSYPPFARLAKFIFTGKNENQTIKTAETVRNQLINVSPQFVEFHPVTSCGYAKIKNQYRYQFLVKGTDLSFLKTEPHFEIPSTIRMMIDIDPMNTFF